MTRPTSRRTLLGSTIAAAAGLVPYAASGFPQLTGSPQPDKIRIGQIGTRHAHASGKMETLRSLGDLYEVVGVVEPDAERRAMLSQTDAYRDLRWMTAEQLLNVGGLAAVAIETEVDRLVPAALQAVEAGMHIHLDKPAGTSMTALRRLHNRAERRGVTIQMGYMLRYNPAFQLMFQIVNDGWLGQLSELDATIGKLAGIGMRRQLAKFSGGGMFELGCHLIDAMVTVLGKPIRVTAFNRHTRPETDGFADNQLAVYEYPNLVATIRCNHLDPFGFSRRQFSVVGDQGNFRIAPLEPPQATLALNQPRGGYRKGAQALDFKPNAGRYDEEFRDLARVTRGEAQLKWDSSHDLAVHEAVLLGSGMPLQ